MQFFEIYPHLLSTYPSGTLQRETLGLSLIVIDYYLLPFGEFLLKKTYQSPYYARSQNSKPPQKSAPLISL
jgi:hypothetical protein